MAKDWKENSLTVDTHSYKSWREIKRLFDEIKTKQNVTPDEAFVKEKMQDNYAFCDALSLNQDAQATALAHTIPSQDITRSFPYTQSLAFKDKNGEASAESPNPMRPNTVSY